MWNQLCNKFSRSEGIRIQCPTLFYDGRDECFHYVASKTTYRHYMEELFYCRLHICERRNCFIVSCIFVGERKKHYLFVSKERCSKLSPVHYSLMVLLRAKFIGFVSFRWRIFSFWMIILWSFMVIILCLIRTCTQTIITTCFAFKRTYILSCYSYQRYKHLKEMPWSWIIICESQYNLK